MIASMHFADWCKKIFFRSDYFKTAEAFHTATHNTTKVIEVKECPHRVLEAVINFMYGIDLPGSFSTTDVDNLLTMADLYLMDDLKDAVASQMALYLNKDNILDIYHLAEKYTAGKMKEVCNHFILTNIIIAKEVLGVDASTISTMKEEGSKVKRDMIVRCNTSSFWWHDSRTGISSARMDVIYCEKVTCEAGTVGRIVDGRGNVKWNSIHDFHDQFDIDGKLLTKNRGDINHLEILTPPIKLKADVLKLFNST